MTEGVIPLRKTQPKTSAEEAHYVEDGEFPFVCGTCRNYEGGSMLCEIVEGPYDGKVYPQGSCDLWKPGSGLGRR